MSSSIGRGTTLFRTLYRRLQGIKDVKQRAFYIHSLKDVRTLVNSLWLWLWLWFGWPLLCWPRSCEPTTPPPPHPSVCCNPPHCRSFGSTGTTRVPRTRAGSTRWSREQQRMSTGLLQSATQPEANEAEGSLPQCRFAPFPLPAIVSWLAPFTRRHKVQPS